MAVYSLVYVILKQSIMDATGGGRDKNMENLETKHS